MEENYCHNLLRTEGFELIGSLNYDFQINLWWHPELHLELSLVCLNGWALLRAVKHYRLTAMGEDGELYARDLAALDSYLTTHFDEVHLWSSTFRDITPSMAARKIQEKNFRHIANEETVDTNGMTRLLQNISDDISATQAVLQRNESLLKLNRRRPNLLQEHLPNQIAQKRRHLEKLRTQKKSLTQRLAVQKHLESQYMQKGEGAAILFTCCSNIQLINQEGDFADAVYSIVKELQDVNKYQIRQKLQGGKLHIYIKEVDSPGVSLLTRWVGAVLNPRQLAKFGQQFADLCRIIEDQIMVLPRKDILLGSSVQDEKKLVGTRIIRNFLKKLEVVPTATDKTIQSPKSSMPVWIGNTSEGAIKFANPWELPLDKMGHVYISGTTGAGKTFLGFVLVEGALAYPNLSIIVLTPNNQWVGLLCPEDRTEILGRYELFGLKPEQARSVNFKYYGVGQNIGEPLPQDLRELATGLHIVSFKYANDWVRCETSAKIIMSTFNVHSRSESSQPKAIVILDEAPRFTRKHVDKKAHTAAAKSEKAINLITAEGRKYGMSAVILSQTLRHFSYDLAAVRQNISTRIFMRNSDGEVDHASQFMDNGRDIIELRTTEAFVCNSEWEVVKVSVRPPLSKVWEPTDADVRKLVGSVSKAQPTLSREAQAVLDRAYEQYSQSGNPAKLALIADQLGITSRRKLNNIVEELEKASAASFQRLQERGKPLVVIPIGVRKTNINRD